jgi:1,4-alpha-glucan branching enzyme
VDLHDWEQSILCYLRRRKDPADFLLVVCNFTPVLRTDYLVGVPEGGYYRELLNSEASVYGGSNLGNGGGVQAEPRPVHGRPYSLRLVLPPLSITVFRRD